MPSGNFNPGVNFLLKNISDDDVEVTIIPAGQKDSIKTILGVGWNPERCCLLMSTTNQYSIGCML